MVESSTHPPQFDPPDPPGDHHFSTFVGGHLNKLKWWDHRANLAPTAVSYSLIGAQAGKSK